MFCCTELYGCGKEAKGASWALVAPKKAFEA
jgi:hypothetical protein